MNTAAGKGAYCGVEKRTVSFSTSTASEKDELQWLQAVVSSMSTGNDSLTARLSLHGSVLSRKQLPNSLVTESH